MTKSKHQFGPEERKKFAKRVGRHLGAVFGPMTEIWVGSLASLFAYKLPQEFDDDALVATYSKAAFAADLELQEMGRRGLCGNQGGAPFIPYAAPDDVPLVPTILNGGSVDPESESGATQVDISSSVKVIPFGPGEMKVEVDGQSTIVRFGDMSTLPDWMRKVMEERGIDVDAMAEMCPPASN